MKNIIGIGKNEFFNWQKNVIVNSFKTSWVAYTFRIDHNNNDPGGLGDCKFKPRPGLPFTTSWQFEGKPWYRGRGRGYRNRGFLKPEDAWDEVPVVVKGRFEEGVYVEDVKTDMGRFEDGVYVEDEVNEDVGRFEEGVYVEDVKIAMGRFEDGVYVEDNVINEDVGRFEEGVFLADDIAEDMGMLDLDTNFHRNSSKLWMVVVPCGWCVKN